uniref:Armadillo-like helical domain containing 4 n=1 Tax=Jaculus jaculus TaxID=51337 RepID=A0A8C5KUH6_JACJA
RRQDSITGIVNSANLYAHFSSNMSRPIGLHICLAFCSLLFLNFAAQCLAFPEVESRETAHAYAGKGPSERSNAEDAASSSVAPKQTPQQMFSEDPLVLSTGPTVMPLANAFSTSEESHLTGARFSQPSGPGLHAAMEPAGTSNEEVPASSQPERLSPERRYSKAMLTLAVSAPPPNPDEEGPFSSSSIQPLAEGTTAATQGFLEYVDDQVFATGSQEGVSLGHSPSSYLNTKETEETDVEAAQSTPFPGVDPMADTEPDGVQPSQLTADIDQATIAKHLLATSEYSLSVEPETGSRLGTPEAIVSVSTAVPAASGVSDEWDDTKLQSESWIRSPGPGDTPETQVRGEPPTTTHESLEGTKGGLSATETSEVAPGLHEGETHVGMALLVTQGGDSSPTFTHQSSFTPTSLMEDTEVSTASLLQSAGASAASTHDDRATFFSETTAPVSEYEADEYQSLGVSLKDIITQEMTTALQELEATLPILTQEQVVTVEVTSDSEPEKDKESPSPVLAAAVPTQPSRRWEPLDTPAFTSAVPHSPKVTPAADLMDAVTGPNEELPAVLGVPVTTPGGTVEAPTIFPVLSSEERTVPSISHPNTAASYGLDQLESEEGEDEDEEDEEDEDEEEEDEEEDEEDKDTDALDDSFDGDTELPGFTVPGVTSQEPGVESGNIDALEGATYQVPDAIEWEQQNQGLVRSWMEKLKDKAGYMSGMLVPVGVGIAGALFILAALYSIKVMNRRRRNGFKRHKRKQREFNSMQDRVMLLADSSEDEF